MSTFYQKKIILTNVRNKKREKFFLLNLSQSFNHAIWRRFLIVLILTRYEHPHQTVKIRTLYQSVKGSDFYYILIIQILIVNLNREKALAFAQVQ